MHTARSNILSIKPDLSDPQLARYMSLEGLVLSQGPAILEAPELGMRERTVLYSCADFEIVLNKWGAGCASALHGHGGSDCWFRVLKGEICEKRFRPYSTKFINAVTLKELDESSIRDAEAFHSLHAKDFSVSVHVYHSPIKSIQVLSRDRVWETVAL